METLTISKRQARRFILAHQGLWPPYALAGKCSALDYVRRVGCIQFDPLNIVGHNPELVLQARVSDLRPTMLQELLYQDRKLLDGWDKNISKRSFSYLGTDRLRIDGKNAEQEGLDWLAPIIQG